VEILAEVYPELTERMDFIQNSLLKEEESFFASIERAVDMLDTIFMNPKLAKSKVIPGRVRLVIAECPECFSPDLFY